MLATGGAHLLLQRLGRIDIFIMMVVIVAVLIVDISIVRIATSIGGLRPSYIGLFAGLVVFFAIVQYLVLDSVRHYKDGNRYIIDHHIIDKTVVACQYVLLAILSSVILQMVFTSSYNVNSLSAVILISYGLTFTLLASMAKRFFSWFKSNRSLIVLVYGLAVTTLSINSIFAIFQTVIEFITGPEVIRDIRSLTGGYESSDVMFGSLYAITSVLSFVSMWFATILMMRHYSRKLGKAKYWISVCIPLAYFLSQFQPLFLYTFSDLRLRDPVLFGVVYNLIFTVAKPAGGILFGLAFWTIARHLSNPAVKRYMLISAFGVMLLFAANQTTYLVLVPYPPFSLVTISFMGLASYLFYLGIYAASISVAEDSRLRRTIRRAAIKESTKFLDSIGTAEMEQEIEKRVIAMTSAAQTNVERETGISSSLDEGEIKKYLQEALQEIKGKGVEKGSNLSSKKDKTS